MSFRQVAIIGLGLIGGSIGLAVRELLPGTATRGYDSDPEVRRRARERRLAADRAASGGGDDTAEEGVGGAAAGRRRPP